MGPDPATATRALRTVQTCSCVEVALPAKFDVGHRLCTPSTTEPFADEAWQSVNISRQNMLQQTSAALQLPIYKVYTVQEGISQFLGCIKMAILPKDIFGYREQETLHGDIALTEYGAIEGVAEMADVCLVQNIRLLCAADLGVADVLAKIWWRRRAGRFV